MSKFTIKQTIEMEKSMDYNKISRYENKQHIHIMDRTNSLAEVGRIYVYLFGSTKGYDKFSKQLREDSQDSRKDNGKVIEWHFNIDYLWEYLTSNEKIDNILKTRKIDNYEELSIRSYLY